MIRLIRDDGMEILLNVDLIKTINEGMETTITLTTGEEVLVKNSHNDIVQKIAAFRSGISESKETQKTK
jgi:flagellar protein FlbD